jgi:hypothetical protein
VSYFTLEIGQYWPHVFPRRVEKQLSHCIIQDLTRPATCTDFIDCTKCSTSPYVSGIVPNVPAQMCPYY